MAKSIAKSRQKMELSHLESQRNLLTKDVDLTALSFITRNLPPLRFEELVVGGEVVRTIEGASTVTITINDDDGIIRKSGRLAKAVDIKIDGLWFRLVKVQKAGVNITLTFESREVAVLRTYKGRRVVGWGKMRRSRFCQILVEEVKEMSIPFRCPDLEKPKKVKTKKERLEKREPGMGFHNERRVPVVGTGVFAQTPTIKGRPATGEQMDNVEQVLDVGNAMGANRKVLISSIMTIIQESSAHNLGYGDASSVGLFQEIDIWGSVAERRNVEHAATRYFGKAMKYDSAHPNAKLWEISQAAQRSGYPRAYAQWQGEAERLVTAYGVVGDSDQSISDGNLMQLAEAVADTEKWQFTRGRPKPPGTPGKDKWENEDTWTCLQRLANEVNWRCFEVSGSIYFTTDKHLFKSAPRARLSEQDEAVNWIDFDLDIGKTTSQLTIEAYIDRWAAPPGTVIEVFDMGPVNGRWLATEIRRGIFDELGTITLKKPGARLPEPKREDASSLLEAFGETDKYVPTPGFTPDPPGNLPTGRALREAVLNNTQIDFTRTSQTQDIATGNIDERVLRFLLSFTEAGYSATITALKSDHNKYTSAGRVSAHSAGRAVDIGNYSERNLAPTRAAMTWINANKLELGYAQLIGPIDELVVPLGTYDQTTLEQHDDHLHIGYA